MKDSHIPDWIKEAEEKGTMLVSHTINRPTVTDILAGKHTADEPRAPKGMLYQTISVMEVFGIKQQDSGNGS